MTGREWLESGRARGVAVARRQRLPHASEAERLLLDHLVPERVRRVLDLGTGEGHLLGAIVAERAGVEAVGLDLSPAMIAAASERFGEDEGSSSRVTT